MEEKKEDDAKIDDAEGSGAVSPPPPHPALDFPTFILSLSSSVLMNLGEIKNPMTDKAEKDLPMARHTIDLISMLREKTEGNLTDDEVKLIENVLADLRMKYIKLTGN